MSARHFDRLDPSPVPPSAMAMLEKFEAGFKENYALLASGHYAAPTDDILRVRLNCSAM